MHLAQTHPIKEIRPCSKSMSSVHRVYLGLGANVGDPVQQLIEASRLLEQRLGAVVDSERVTRSAWYLSSPMGYADQPFFINAALCVRTCMDEWAVLSVAKEIENQLGRRRDPSNQNAPRTIDIDILLSDRTDVTSEPLTIPHPRLFERRFALQPLLQVLPQSHEHRAACERALEHCASDPEQQLFTLTC